MRKVITLQLWLDNDNNMYDEHYMDEDLIQQDIELMIGRCWHNFEIIKYETMDISNKRDGETYENI